jgi:hypothetical protein
MKSRELDLLLAGWPTAQPTTGFADRVLGAVAPPVRARPAGRVQRVPARRARRFRLRSALAVAAVVAVTVLVPLFIARAVGPVAGPQLASAPADFDLGPQQD